MTCSGHSLNAMSSSERSASCHLEQRAVIVLHHYMGLSGDEIGRILDLPAGTVRSRLHYARQQMRATIEADSRPVAGEGLA